MKPYGKKKIVYKIHPHNECDICAENKVNKKTARRKAKQEIEEQEITYCPECYEDKQTPQERE